MRNRLKDTSHIEFEQSFGRGNADNLSIEIDVRDKFGYGGKQNFLAFRREDGPNFLFAVEKDVIQHAKLLPRCVKHHGKAEHIVQIDLILIKLRQGGFRASTNRISGIP